MKSLSKKEQKLRVAQVMEKLRPIARAILKEVQNDGSSQDIHGKEQAKKIQIKNGGMERGVKCIS